MTSPVRHTIYLKKPSSGSNFRTLGNTARSVTTVWASCTTNTGAALPTGATFTNMQTTVLTRTGVTLVRFMGFNKPCDKAREMTFEQFSQWYAAQLAGQVPSTSSNTTPMEAQ